MNRNSGILFDSVTQTITASNPMKPILVLLTLLLAIVGQINAAETSAPARPNIIFILADDLGIGNVGCYGADNYKTPHIDALASGGIRYTRAYTAPLCGPSRTLIMTGRYAFRTGATNQDRVGLLKPSVETMLPKILKPAGYVSSAVGKWSQLPLQPSDWGFDDYLRYNGSGVYWNKKAKGEPYVVNGENKTLRDKEYMPDLLHQHVTDFITQHRDDPFFVYYSLSSVHGELQPTPDSAPDSKDLMRDNIAYMDKLVGKLVAELERLKLREKTLIVFMGDNGTGKGQADEATVGGRRLSGQKGDMLEGGRSRAADRELDRRHARRHGRAGSRRFHRLRAVVRGIGSRRIAGGQSDRRQESGHALVRRNSRVARVGLHRTRAQLVRPRAAMEAESSGRTLRYDRRAIRRESRRRRHERRRRNCRAPAPASCAR